MDAPQANWSQKENSHFVQFYEDDSFLIESVGAFFAAGLHTREGALVIATGEHREALEEKLAAQKIDVKAMCERGHYVALDAAESLSRFMVNGLPDEALFKEFAVSLLAPFERMHRPVRVFGEMVALLWAEGNKAATLRLEELWNQLGRKHQFSLFCAYPMRNFCGAEHGEILDQICCEHATVIPAESYTTQSDSTDRLRTIALLQQKANSLATEITERKHAESNTREQQTRLTMAITLAELGIWEIDLQTRTLTCSEEGKAHLGLPTDESITYVRFCELIHTEDRERVQNALEEAMAHGGDFSAEYRIVTPQGQLRWIAARARCFHNGGHRLLGAMLDITERRLDPGGW